MSWDEAAATWDTDPFVRAYAAGARRSLDEALAARGRSLRGSRILDFGCGTGLLTVAMADEATEVVGLDTSPEMVRRLYAKGRANVRATTGPLDDPTLGAFDGITASSVLGFVDDLPATVAALAARLVPGGWLVHWDWRRAAPGEAGLTEHEVEAALRGAGLVDVSVDTGFEVEVDGHRMAPLRGIGVRPAP